MREIYISDECEIYILKDSSQRVQRKFKYILELIEKQKIVHTSIVEKLSNTDYYELKIKAENQIRIIIFTIDKENFNEANEIILLNGFLKRTNKDYQKAVKVADKLLSKYGL
jgi:phage-related protein